MLRAKFIIGGASFKGIFTTYTSTVKEFRTLFWFSRWSYFNPEQDSLISKYRTYPILLLTVQVRI